MDVGIIMGSQSDWETMRHSAAILEELGIPHEAKVVSAHRTPQRLYDYATGAKARGIKVIIAGAGGAAHLPGMAAAMTPLPVLGVPVESKALSGLDSLLSIAQMPGGVPVGTLATIAAKLRPGTASLAIAQDRCAEKAFVAEAGGHPAEWRAIDGPADITAAVEALGLPLVLKTRRDGYDGKGQVWLRTAQDVAGAWEQLGRRPLVAEKAISFAAEFSVVLARGADGSLAFYDSPRNTHEDGILRRSELPAGAPIDGQVEAARRQAGAIAERLGHIGVLTVEFFACADGPMVNEIAPRVHNSGHWTIEGAATSQFAQHIRAIAGLPLGPTALRGGRVVMDNLIGDEVERWAELVSDLAVSPHLYGKGAPRPGRKMGHLTRVN